jgi:quercetin dioxygenase-like cupin family protein
VAQVGQVITNPITYERITFRTTTEETEGQSLVFDCAVAPGGTPLPPHVHSNQEERFEMASGTLGIMCGGETRILTAGERATLPVGIKHQWWNAGKSVARFRVEAVPARNLERVLEVVSIMSRNGRMNKHGIPKNLIELANLGRLSNTYVPVVPIILQKITIACISTVGRPLGYKPDFSQYWSRSSLQEAVATSTRDEVA